MLSTQIESLEVIVHGRRALEERLARWEAYVARGRRAPLGRHPAWLKVLEEGLGHVPYCLEAVEQGRTCGLLPLIDVRTALFGRYLVSLPYLNYGGVVADDERSAALLIDRAVELAGLLDARYLELRHERGIDHVSLGHRMDGKVHMRLPLPATAEELWDGLSPKVRNQVRKGQKIGLTVAWGNEELLPEFYDVFARNMRDLGTPVYGKRLFAAVLRQFPGRGELCVTRLGGRAVAAALLTHGWGVTEVPSASSLREFNATNANMLMYWSILERVVQRGQEMFDFGRSSRESNTYRFKKQWGAIPGPAEWQYHLRAGSVSEMRPENVKYRRLIRLWQRLPVPLTRLIGPPIVRGIP
jgi:FemAB-related protein (PEP-CTERM system-associated)